MSVDLELVETISIGTIGHIDHGKTSFASAVSKAMSVYAKQSGINVKVMGYGQIDNTKEERERGITINKTTFEYYSLKNPEAPAAPGNVIRYIHVDCPGHADYVKNMISGAFQVDVAILIVAANDSVNLQTREHIIIASQIGIKNVAVFINKIDLFPSEAERQEAIELVLLEIQDLLSTYNITLVCWAAGSAAIAISDTPAAEKELENIRNFYKQIEKNIVLPERNYDKPFMMFVDAVYSITGRGTVISGKVEYGKVTPGQEIEYISAKTGASKKVVVTSIEAFNKPQSAARAGQNVGILCRGFSSDDHIERGDIVCKEGSFKFHQAFSMSILLLNPDEGGRTTPFTTGYRPSFFIGTGNFTGEIELLEVIDEKSGQVTHANPDKPREVFANPGNRIKVNVRFEHPVPMRKGDRTIIREGNKTIGCGFVDADDIEMERASAV